MRSRSSELARARPLLGTLVEIRVCDAPNAISAVTAAFNAVADVHRLMSAHEAASDIGRLNRFARTRAVHVSAHTWRVLRMAGEISRASEGAFDICVAPLLARWGYLPRAIGRHCHATAGWQAVELLPRRRVRFRAPVAIDVGGIAKGYAVDRAARILREHGIRRFVVNAGGDLRVGEALEVIHVRHPAAPGRLLPVAQARGSAAATSAAYFAQTRSKGRLLHPIAVPGTRRCANLRASITVFARQCAVADALTKVVAVLGDASLPVLRRFGAEACRVGPHGELERVGSAAA